MEGKAQGLVGGFVPQDWNEITYLEAHTDVAAIDKGTYLRISSLSSAGKAEGRIGGFIPDGWNEGDI